MKCRGRGFDAGNSPMAARRRRSSASQHSLLHPAALLAVAAVLVAAGSASAQAPRAWAGGDAAREPLRVAAAPPAADAPGAQETVIPTGNLLATIRDGGVLMIPLLGCSFALAVFGIERAVSLRTSRVAPKIFVERLIERLQARDITRGEAIDVCDDNGSPAARVFASALRRWGKPAVEIEQAAIDACERELNHLRRYRRVFNGVATIGPLLGLLGTVFGLIRSFNDVASSGAMGRPDLLARGFGEALITTAMGLLVAIPAMVLHWVFTSRVDRLAMRLDETCQLVIDEISDEAVGAAKRKAG
ncbi:MAG: Biopolymer transport protein ExbB [Planctomycetota bacterium]|jgi:biopolymer transport protein ExbB